jgi:hypothetical protein
MEASVIDPRRLRAALAEVGWRHSTAAEAVGVSPAQLTRAIHGRLPVGRIGALREALERVLELPSNALAQSGNADSLARPRIQPRRGTRG